MFLDFRALNKFTIKDKFYIPIIDDVLDELNGVFFFTKLDLHPSYSLNQDERSGYFQDNFPHTIRPL